MGSIVIAIQEWIVCFHVPLRIVVTRDAVSLTNSSTRGICAGIDMIHATAHLQDPLDRHIWSIGLGGRGQDDKSLDVLVNDLDQIIKGARMRYD